MVAWGIEALTSRNLGYPVNSYGADPTGTNDSTAAFKAALAALPTVTVNNGTTSAVYPVGTILLGSGSYKVGVTADIGNVGPFVSIIGPGSTACIIYDYGTASGGAAISMHNAVRPADDTFDTMLSQSAPYGLAAKMDGFTIDGTNAAANRSALDLGDFEGLQFPGDLRIQHYNKSGSSGVNFNNQYAWINSFRGRMALYDCTTHVLFTRGGAGDIFNGNCELDFLIYALAGQDGVAVTNGIQMYYGSLGISGSFLGSSSPQTNAVIRLTGTDGSGHYSGLNFMTMNVAVEKDAGGANGPYTIYFGSPGNNVVYGCQGILAFSNTLVNSNGTIGFYGEILGDTNLGGGGYSQVFTSEVPVLVQSLNSGVPAKIDFSGQNNGSYYSGFNMGDGVYPLDGAGHYWGIQHTSSHSFLIFSYNGAGSYVNQLSINESGQFLSKNNTLDDGSGNAALAGGVTTKLRTITASAPLTSTDSTVLLNAATLTATLPTAVGIAGRQYTVKLIAASTATVATTSSQTIDGATTYSLTANHKYVTVVSDGANWQITANN